MPGTPYETPLYLVGSGQPGPVVLVLGGVHGDEPGGWLAAQRVMEMKPNRGALLVIPRANRQATLIGQRTTPEMGDLNRLYPGSPDGLPMSRMAYEIVRVIEKYQVSVVLDLHESWQFYKDRPVRSTAFLGQTVSAFPNDRGVALGQAVVDGVNRSLRSSQEELIYREYPPRASLEGTPPAFLTPPADTQAARTGGTASLGLGRRFPEMAVLLVEMAQQLPLERRIALHVAAVEQALGLLGMR